MRGSSGRFWLRWHHAVAGESPESKRLAWATWLFVAHLLTVPAIALSNALLALAALVVPWRTVRRRLRDARPLLSLAGAYLLLTVGSIAASYEPLRSTRALTDPFNFLTPVLAVALVIRASQARWIARALVVVAALAALYALVQYLLGANELYHRPTGPFSHYMTLGGFLILADCFLLAWVAFDSGWRRWQAWLAMVLIQTALLLSYTRNAWIALVLLFTLVIAVRRPRLLVAWAPVLLLLALLAPAPLVARAGSIFDLSKRSNYDRLCMAYAGVGMVVDRPLLGQGPTMVRDRYPLYRHPTAPSVWVPHLHNSFLNLGAERGLLSLAAMLAMLAVSAAHAFRRLRGSPSPPRLERELLVAVLLVLLASVVTGLFEDYWNDTEIQRLVLFGLALPFCLGRSTDSASVAGEDSPSRLDPSR